MLGQICKHQVAQQDGYLLVCSCSIGEASSQVVPEVEDRLLFYCRVPGNSKDKTSDSGVWSE